MGATYSSPSHGIASAAQELAQGRVDNAQAICWHVLRHELSNACAWHMLAVVNDRLGRPKEGLPLVQRAINLEPAVPDYHNTLGILLAHVGRAKEAIEAFQAALTLSPDFTLAISNLGHAYHAMGRFAEAAMAHERAMTLGGDPPSSYNPLANAYGEQGRIAEAIECLSKAAQLQPGSSQAHSDYLFAMHYAAELNPEEVFAEHRKWEGRGTFHAGPARPHVNDRTVDRRLRIGYVSPDFREHPVSRFMEPILRNHDTANFEIFCYGDVAKADAVTRRIQSLQPAWRQTAGLSHAQFAEQVRLDRVDLLIDLTGHMPSNRLPAFAFKPAPVQVAYLGYPDTTGLTAMDYRFTDALHDPPGQTERYQTEQLVRLDRCCWAYQPDLDCPEPNDLPAASYGYVTFASLNRMWKHNPRVISAWAEILKRVPRSRLMFLVHHPSHVDPCVFQVFEAQGIPKDRLVPVNLCRRPQYLRRYLQADIALDPFPYNGHTTTLDALWMGIPVVTLAGNTHVSRAGVCVLTNAGLPDLIAHTHEHYVQKAVDLAEDHDRLQGLRKSLRDSLRSSPFLDHKGLTRRIEAAYQAMWQSWCSGAAAKF